MTPETMAASIDPPLRTPETGASLGQLMESGESSASGPVRYVGGNFEAHDFSGANLEDCDFSGARLTGANFVGANLRGALLFDVDAEGAEFAGADLTGAVLRDGRFARAGFGSATLSGAQAIDAVFEDASFAQADVSGANFVGAKGSGTCWREAKLTGADLRRADLPAADFTAVDLAGARFDDAELNGAKLSRVKGFRTASWLGIDASTLDRRGASFLHDFIEDQNFLSEYRSQGRSYEWTYRVWWLTSDCGRSVARWAACSTVLALVFALLYTQVEIDFGRHETWLSPFYFSVVTLTTLGYGDVLPATAAAQAVVIFEVVIGYVMLGGLLSLVSNKLSRRAS